MKNGSKVGVGMRVVSLKESLSKIVVATLLSSVTCAWAQEAIVPLTMNGPGIVQPIVGQYDLPGPEASVDLVGSIKYTYNAYYYGYYGYYYAAVTYSSGQSYGYYGLLYSYYNYIYTYYAYMYTASYGTDYGYTYYALVYSYYAQLYLYYSYLYESRTMNKYYAYSNEVNSHNASYYSYHGY